MNTNDPQSSPSAKATSSLSANPVQPIYGFQVANWITRHHRHAYETSSGYFFASVLMNSFYNEKKGYAFPTQEQLAEMMGYEVRQIRRLVKMLKESGNGTLWQVSRGFKTKNGSMANRYTPKFLDEIRTGVPSIWSEAEKAKPSADGPEDETAENETTVEVAAVPASSSVPVSEEVEVPEPQEYFDTPDDDENYYAYQDLNEPDFSPDIEPTLDLDDPFAGLSSSLA